MHKSRKCLTSEEVRKPQASGPRSRTPVECAAFTISGGGYGIHWSELDEDLGVEGLLLGKKSNESAASFKRWLDGRKVQPL